MPSDVRGKERPRVPRSGRRGRCAREGVFGPVITVIRADDDDHALALANDTEYGVSSAVFSRNVEHAMRFALKLQAGMTHVNDFAGK